MEAEEAEIISAGLRGQDPDQNGGIQKNCACYESFCGLT